LKTLIYNETGAAPTASPTQLLNQYLGANWTETNPPYNKILNDSYWTGNATNAYASMKFKELSTRPTPMTTGWGMWHYRSTIRIILAAWYDMGGKYPLVLENVTNEIERLCQTDALAMNSYGISAIWVSKFETVVDYPEKKAYKDSVADCAIEVDFIAAKTVVEI
jgi:hypothetical protein